MKNEDNELLQLIIETVRECDVSSDEIEREPVQSVITNQKDRDMRILSALFQKIRGKYIKTPEN